MRVLDNIIFTHIPHHPGSVSRFRGNVHGHWHNNVPPLHFGPHYLNVSIEMTDYYPVSLEDVKRTLQRQHDEWIPVERREVERGYGHGV
jgi:calcineurin-like phosphoesterase family protein